MIRPRLPDLSMTEACLLRVCSSYGLTWDWGTVRALMGDLPPESFTRIAEQLAAKGLTLGTPGDAYGEITELGRTWLDGVAR